MARAILAIDPVRTSAEIFYLLKIFRGGQLKGQVKKSLNCADSGFPEFGVGERGGEVLDAVRCDGNARV
jgi:hypothetical protein